MQYAVRALIAASGAVFVAAGMYALGQALYGGEMADGYPPWDAVARDVVITSILVGLALATPHRRGLRLLWLLAGRRPGSSPSASIWGRAAFSRSGWCSSAPCWPVPRLD